MRRFRRLLTVMLFIFLVPALVSTGLWALADRPTSWRNADWGPSGVLTPATSEPGAVIHIMSARAGGLKGALAVHSWIVMKRAGAGRYERYEKVGWGDPVRHNAYPPDGNWYSNEPFIVHTVRGNEAERLIPKIEEAIAAYPYSRRGGYRIWPGPNSNSFVAYVLREVPGIGAVLPPIAVGRDFLAGGRLFEIDRDGLDLHVSLFGLAGVAAGVRSGLEFNLFGLVTGIDVAHPAIKIAGFGRIGL
ncbi:MAG: DUF3750 domain-containing protein [Salaquimonas sp.]|nr:DUF3750 domain-containing protein [Salaquimonas sp.]